VKEIEVELWTKESYFSEIGQAIGVRYAFLSPEKDGNKQCHGWIKCRDFLQDAFRWHHAGNNGQGIFGFSYEPKDDPPLDTEKMRMLVDYTAGKPDKATLDCTISILKLMESHGGIEPQTKILGVKDHDNIYVYEGAKDWMGSSFMISMYTFLIRLGARKIPFKNKEELDSELRKISESPAEGGDNDVNYLKTVLPFLYKIIENREKLLYIKGKSKPFLSGQSINMFHNYSGVVSLAKYANGSMDKMNSKGLEDLLELSKYIK